MNEARARPTKRDVVHARGRLTDRGRDTRGAGYGNEADETPAWASPAAPCASRVRLLRIAARAVGSEVIAVTARRGVVLRGAATSTWLISLIDLLDPTARANSDTVAVVLIVCVQREAVSVMWVHRTGCARSCRARDLLASPARADVTVARARHATHARERPAVIVVVASIKNLAIGAGARAAPSTHAWSVGLDHIRGSRITPRRRWRWRRRRGRW